MHPALNLNLFLVKEHVGMFKAANNYDIHDPETGEVILHCREEQLGFFTKMLRFTDYKRMTPFHVEIKTPGGPPLVSVKRGISVFLSKVDVMDEAGARKNETLFVGDSSVDFETARNAGVRCLPLWPVETTCRLHNDCAPRV